MSHPAENQAIANYQLRGITRNRKACLRNTPQAAKSLTSAARARDGYGPTQTGSDTRGRLESFKAPVRGRMPRHFSSAQALEKWSEA
jgi:hypothetical protein